MKKIGFVTPWYGKNIPGGAEALLRGLVKKLHESGVELEVLTTCVKQFTSDWNTNFHKAGYRHEDGIAIRRFEVRKRDTEMFDNVNYKLMRGMRLSAVEESVFIKEMVNSPDLYRWMAAQKDDYSLFVFIPYMFGTTYYGSLICPEKSVLIPCFHDEAYVYMEIFKKQFSKVKGMVFNSHPEKVLAERIYDLSNVETAILGMGIDTNANYNPEAFADKYKIKKPFILYAGRKDPGKNIHLLIKYFQIYKSETNHPLQLVLIGGGEVNIPEEIKNDVFDLGFVPTQDKFDAYTAAALLCQPSTNESFSIVLMESWLCGRPALVHADCPVTKNFVQDSNGGLYFRTFHEFVGCVNYILGNAKEATQMGKLGQRYVRDRFSREVVTKNYISFFKKLSVGT